MTLPAEVVKQAMASGWSVDEIAWDQGVTTAEVCRVMRALEMASEVASAQGGRAATPRIDLPMDEIRAARERGESFEEIARRYGVCSKTVRNRINGAR